jgi:hypothetical protein
LTIDRRGDPEDLEMFNALKEHRGKIGPVHCCRLPEVYRETDIKVSDINIPSLLIENAYEKPDTLWIVLIALEHLATNTGDIVGILNLPEGCGISVNHCKASLCTLLSRRPFVYKNLRRG